ncbi:ketopantoate reductase PanE/ApbA family protein, partial [Vibrio parahaemolyticus V-223/04]
MAPIGAIF